MIPTQQEIANAVRDVCQDALQGGDTAASLKRLRDLYGPRYENLISFAVNGSRFIVAFKEGLVPPGEGPLDSFPLSYEPILAADSVYLRKDDLSVVTLKER